MGMNALCTQHFEKHREDILRRIQSLAKELQDRGEPQYHLDIVFLGALRRSFSLTCGFFDLVAAENYVCAAPLVRLQLDNAIRTVACIHVHDVKGFIKHVTSGKRIDQLRDQKGRRLTDKHIVDHLVEQEQVPWVRRVYQEGSRFVHLSDVHLFGLESKGHLSEKGPPFSEPAFIELVEAFVMATELFYMFIESWLRLRASPGTDPRPQLPVPEGNTLTGRLKAILRIHGLIPCSYDELILVDGRIAPAMRVSADKSNQLPTGVSIQIDVEVLLEDERILCEAFAGLGPTVSAAEDDALHNFSMATLPVLRVALWERAPNRDAATEQWNINGQIWQVTIGNDLFRVRNPSAPKIPQEIMEFVKARIGEKINEGCHWLRIFYANLRGEQTVEVLLDNEPWHEAQEAVGALPWKATSEYYSFRRFIILQSP